MNVTAARRIARADLLGRPVQTGLTALAIFAAATALVVTLALRSGLDDPFQAAQDATRGAHVSAFGEGDLSDLTTLPGVAAGDTRTSQREQVTLNGAGTTLALETLPAPTAPVDVPHVTEGRRPAGPDRGARGAQLRRASRACASATRSPACASPASP